LNQSEKAARNATSRERDVEARIQLALFTTSGWYFNGALSRSPRLQQLYGSQKPVTPPGQRFYVPRVGCGISEGFAQFVHSRVQAVVEIDEGIGWPQFLL
jgi:hypothetical protein